MAKIDLEHLKMLLNRAEIEPRKIAEIIQEAQAEIAKDADEEKPKDGKYQYLVLVYDPEGELEGKEFTGQVIRIPEENSVYSATEGVHKAAYEFNTTKKGRRMPVKTVGEAFEHVPAKIFKEFGIKAPHKEPVFLLPIDGLIPMETTDKKIDKRKEA